MSTPPSGYRLGVSALVDAGVEFVLVGVGGINFYARDASDAFTTLDLDRMLSIRGFPFAEMADDARAFRVGEVGVRAGRLEKLLRSQEPSGRPKEIEFLRRFAAEGDEEGDG